MNALLAKTKQQLLASSAGKTTTPTKAETQVTFDHATREREALLTEAAEADINGSPGPSDFAARLALLDAKLARRDATISAAEKKRAIAVKRFEADEAEYLKAAHQALKDGPLAEAQQQLGEAWEVLRDALVRLIGVDRLTFGEVNPSLYGRVNHLRGPAEELVELLRRGNTWTESPYSIRPRWLAKSCPPDLSGVAEAESDARAWLQQEEGS